MKKRGQVNVVALVLIILIVLVAGLIIWNVVVPLIREQGEEADIGSLIVSLEVKEAILFVHGALDIAVSRGAGKGEIESLQFIFYDDVGGSHTEVKEGGINELETRTYQFSPMPLGEIQRVAVVPVVGGKLGRESRVEVSEIFAMPADLISWWRFDNSEDSVGVSDCSGVGIITDSERGEVASFPASVSCGADASLNIVEEIAVSGWIKSSEMVRQGVIRKGRNYELFLSSGGELGFSYGGEEFVSEKKVVDGTWHHIAVSVDPQGIGSVMFYIDGEWDGVPVPFSGTISTSADYLLVGEGYQGQIDELMLFKEALQHNQIGSLYEQFK